MITLSRLNGHVVAINPDLITWIDVTPDTTLSLLGGDKFIVRESLDEVVGKIIEFRRVVGAMQPSALSSALEWLETRRRDSESPSRYGRTNAPGERRSSPPPSAERRTIPPPGDE